MTVNEIINYIFTSPLNTNKAILIQMLQELVVDTDGDLSKFWGSVSTLGKGILGNMVLGG